MQHIPLIEGGSDRPVTKDNRYVPGTHTCQITWNIHLQSYVIVSICLLIFYRQEYIDAYVDYLFNKSVEDHFSAFSDGFHKVCGGKVLVSTRSLE